MSMGQNTPQQKLLLERNIKTERFFFIGSFIENTLLQPEMLADTELHSSREAAAGWRGSQRHGSPGARMQPHGRHGDSQRHGADPSPSRQPAGPAAALSAPWLRGGRRRKTWARPEAKGKAGTATSGPPRAGWGPAAGTAAPAESRRPGRATSAAGRSAAPWGWLCPAAPWPHAPPSGRCAGAAGPWGGAAWGALSAPLCSLSPV